MAKDAKAAAQSTIQNNNTKLNGLKSEKKDLEKKLKDGKNNGQGLEGQLVNVNLAIKATEQLIKDATQALKDAKIEIAKCEAEIKNEKAKKE